MVVIAYKWGGIAFDDKSLIKTLILPSDAKDDVPITFHDDGVDYQVPGGKVFIVGKAAWSLDTTGDFYGRAGESDAADGALTKEVINLIAHTTSNRWFYEEVLGIYTAGKYVTGETNSIGVDMGAGATLYGVEIDA